MEKLFFITIAVTLLYIISGNAIRRDIGTDNLLSSLGITDAIVQFSTMVSSFDSSLQGTKTTISPQFGFTDSIFQFTTTGSAFESLSQTTDISEPSTDSTLPDLSATVSLPQNSVTTEILIDSLSTSTLSTEFFQPPSSCSITNCFLPLCRCAGTDIPGGLSKENTPQIILFTMDDGVTAENFQLYSQLLNGVSNSNGCPIKATFFVSGDNTDYSLVKKLHENGHEIADHSTTHRFPITWWSANATFEDLQTEILTQMTTIKKDVDVTTVGWRTPFLESVENTFKALADNNFLYDSSLGTFPGTRWWPYTLDYSPSLPCYMSNNMCFNNSYPGLWEVPLAALLCDESDSTFAKMLDECQSLTEDATYNFLMLNFKIFYEDNKQPFPMFGHSTWFNNATYRTNGVVRFINDVRMLNDVFFVTTQQAIEWIKSPVGLDENPFSCN